MASSVDLPQPDGPAIDRYSPFFTSKFTSERACVSTSSVMKTLLTPSSRIFASCPLFMGPLYPLYELPAESVESNPLLLVEIGHIRKNHPIPFFQTVLDLNHIHRHLPKGDFHFAGVFAVLLDLENRHSGILLRENRFFDIEHVCQFLDLNGPVDAQV